MATYVQPKYTVTEMRRGGVRAECHLPNCWWWIDEEDTSAAIVLLRQHMRTHGVRVNRTEVN